MSRARGAARPGGRASDVQGGEARDGVRGESAKASAAGRPGIVARLLRPGPFVAVELRPPRLGLDAARGMGDWIDLHHAVRRLVGQGRCVLLTDDAAGDGEEESLAHLAANVGGRTDLSTVLPFLTCKHPLEYCRLFARRAEALGVGGVTVVGGDHGGGAARCVPHGSDLRRILRGETPGLPLGGWANPHRDPKRQARFVTGARSGADYVFTQIVSHHSLDRVKRFRSAMERTGARIPVVYGVFLYRSANPRTLEHLNRYFPVPAREVTREFDAGATPEAMCARTIRRLHDAGADKVYVSNLWNRDVTPVLERVLEAV